MERVERNDRSKGRKKTDHRSKDQYVDYEDRNKDVSQVFKNGSMKDAPGSRNVPAVQDTQLPEAYGDSSEQERLEQERLEQEEKLVRSLEYANRFINKNYLDNLGQYEVMVPEGELDLSQIRLILVKSLMLDKDEDTNEKLTSIYGAIHSIGATLFILIRSDGREVEFYIGTRARDVSAALAGDMLAFGIEGHFPGSKTESLGKEKVGKVLGESIDSEESSLDVATVTTIPSDRTKESGDAFIQGLEKFIDAMKGQKYTALLIAEPLSKEIISERRLGLERLYSTISPFSKTSLSYGENFSHAVTAGITEGLTESINYSVSDSNSEGTTQSHSETDSESTAKGTSVTDSHSASDGGSVSFGDGLSSSSNVSSGTSVGRTTSKTKSHSSSESYGTSSTFSHSVTKGAGQSVSVTTNDGTTDTSGNSRTLTINHENKTVTDMMEKIEAHLERLKSCEAYGLWSTSAYFIGDPSTVTFAAGLFRALITGDDSRLEDSYVNFWRGSEKNRWCHNVLESLQRLSHPVVKLPGNGELWELRVKPTTMVSGKELPIVLGIPRLSVSGVLVDSKASFGRNVYYKNGIEPPKETELLKLGQVMHKGVIDEGSKVCLDMNLFTSHVFITGSTGSGKSNTTYQLISELVKKKIPFLVVEPAKGEYKYDLGSVPGINVFWTNPTVYPLLHVNPFRFPEGTHVLEHLDRLIDIFNTCWPLYSAMPAILKTAVQNAYISCGWDLINSIRIDDSNPHEYPTFEDLERELTTYIDNSEYSSESKGEYKGALVTRVQSLTTGIMGQVFCSPNDIDDEVLFDQFTVIDLSRAASTETKALIMGILVTRLNEYRAAAAETTNAGLKHVTVLEEAHNLLKRVSPGSGSEIQQKSVEMLSSSIAEMRTYGEGFMIIDQSPSAVDISAIKNTNTKIVMNLPLEEDFETIGGSFALNEEQVLEISKLGRGEAIVKQSSWVEPVAIKTFRFDSSKYGIKAKDRVRYNRKALIAALGRICEEIHRQSKTLQWDVERIKPLLDGASLNRWKRREYEQILERPEWRSVPVNNKTLAALYMELIGCKGLFDAVPLVIKPESNGKAKLNKEEWEAFAHKQILQWEERIHKKFDKYAIITDSSAKKEVIRYLIYYMAAVEDREIFKRYFGITNKMRNKK